MTAVQPTNTIFKTQVQDMTKEHIMRPAGDKHLEKNEFDKAVGAYRLGLLYNTGDKKMVLALKKAEKKKLEHDAITAKRLLAQCDEALAFINAGDVRAACELYTGVLASPALHFRVHRTQTSVYETVHESIAKAAAHFSVVFGSQDYMQCLQVHEMIITLSPDNEAFKGEVKETTANMRPIGDAALKAEEFERAVGAYNLGLLYHEGDKKLTLALKKADTKYNQLVCRQTMEWMMVQLEIDAAKLEFQAGMATKEYLRASDAYFFIIEKADTGDKTVGPDSLESFKPEADRFLKNRIMQQEAEDCFRSWKYEHAVGAYRLALVQKPGDKKILLQLKKAEAKSKTVDEGKGQRAEEAKALANEQLPKWMFEGNLFVGLDRLGEATELLSKVQTNEHCSDAYKAEIRVLCEGQEPRFEEVIKSQDYSKALEVHAIITTLSADKGEEMALLQTHFNQKAEALTKDLRTIGDAALADSKFDLAVGAYKCAMLYRAGDKRLTLALKKAESKFQQWKFKETAKAKVELAALLEEGDTCFGRNRFLEAKTHWLAVQNHQHVTPETLELVQAKAETAIAKFDELFAGQRFAWAVDVHAVVVALAPTHDTFLDKAKEMTKDMRLIAEEQFKKERFETAVGACKLGFVHNADDKRLQLFMKKAEKKFDALKAKDDASKNAKRLEEIPKLEARMAEAVESWDKDRRGYAIMIWEQIQTDKFATKEMLETISGKCDVAAAQFDELFAKERYMQSLEMHDMCVKLSPAKVKTPTICDESQRFTTRFSCSAGSSLRAGVFRRPSRPR